jgi:hypothetical protein
METFNLTKRPEVDDLTAIEDQFNLENVGFPPVALSFSGQQIAATLPGRSNPWPRESLKTALQFVLHRFDRACHIIE